MRSIRCLPLTSPRAALVSAAVLLAAMLLAAMLLAAGWFGSGASPPAGATAEVPGGASVDSRPVLHFSPDAIRLGALEAGDERETLMDWRCAGSGTLRVLALRPDCRCAEVSGLPARVQAGQHGRLRVRLRVPRRGGAFVARVRVVTDGPPGHDVYTVVLSGFITRDWTFEPPVLDLGRWEPGQVATRTVALSGPPEAVSGLALRQLEPRIEGLTGRVAALPPVQAAAGACARLRVEVRMPLEAGAHRGYLLVHVPEGEARILPIRCTVVPLGHPLPFPAGKGSSGETEQKQNAHDVQVPDTDPPR